MAVPDEPTQLRELKGRRPDVDRGGRPIKPGLLLPPACPEEPSWAEVFPGAGPEPLRLRLDAQAEWRRVVPVLNGVGLLSSLDRAVVADYCTCWAQLQQCLRRVTADGMVLKTERGNVEHPLLPVLNQLRQAMRGYVTELGLGPVARTRLEIFEADEDPDADLYDTP